MKLNRKKGFSLIELVIVIAIIGILLSIALARFSEATKMANNRKIEADSRVISGTVNAMIVNDLQVLPMSTFSNQYKSLNVIELSGISSQDRSNYSVKVLNLGYIIVKYDSSGSKYSGDLGFTDEACTTPCTGEANPVYFKF